MLLITVVKKKTEYNLKHFPSSSGKLIKKTKLKVQLLKENDFTVSLPHTHIHIIRTLAVTPPANTHIHAHAHAHTGARLPCKLH